MGQLALAQPSVSFLAPDTVCVGSEVVITNQTTGGASSYWSFCAGNLQAAPTMENLGNPSNSLELPVFMDYVYANGNYYGFVVNHRSGRLTRLDFGNSLLNTPTTTFVNIPSSVLPALDGAEDIQVIQNEGKWYAIMVAGYPPTGYQPRIIKLEFGTNIENLNPTATNWGNIGNLLQPIGFHMFQDGNTWYGFTVNAENNTITRFNFTTSFDNTPTAVNLGNIGSLAYPTSIYSINDNGNWRVFVLNAGNNTTTSGNFSISRLDFGNSLLNTPTGINLGNPNNVLKHPRDFTILRSCGETVGFAVNGMPGNNELVKLDFNNNLSATPVGTSLGNSGGFSFPHSISKIFRTGESLYAFVTNVQNNTISRIAFAGCSDASIPNSTAYAPPVFSYQNPGTYTISLLVDEGLATQTAFCKTITVVAPPSDVLPADTSFCELSDLIVAASEENAASYSWSTGATTQTLTINQTGKYWVDLTTRAGCFATDTMMVSMAASPVFSLGNDTSICVGTGFDLSSPITALTYLWSTGSSGSSIRIEGPGEYFLKLENDHCSFSDTIQVASLANPSFTIGLNNVLCKDSTLLLTPNNTGYSSYNWSTGAQTPSILASNPGLYWVEVSNVSGCKARDSLEVIDATPLLVDLGEDQVVCFPHSIELHAPAIADSYLWNTGSTDPSIRIRESGEYIVEVLNQGCPYRDTMNLLVKQPPDLQTSGNQTICPSEKIQLEATSTNGEIIWHIDGSNGNFLEVSAPGGYSVQANMDGCGVATTIVVTEEPRASVNLGPDLAVCGDQPILIEAVVGNGQFLQWEDGSTDMIRSVTQIGQYIASAENRCGIVKDTVLVKPGTGPVTSYQVANAFTPNGDGINDCFGIQNWVLKEVREFSIYNRWGQRVFAGSSANRCWDGRFKGSPQENGGYVYVIQVETECGFISKKGIVMLIK